MLGCAPSQPLLRVSEGPMHSCSFVPASKKGREKERERGREGVLQPRQIKTVWG